MNETIKLELLELIEKLDEKRLHTDTYIEDHEGINHEIWYRYESLRDEEDSILSKIEEIINYS